MGKVLAQLGHAAFSSWATCLPNWGTVLAQHGHAACPGWADFMSDSCPISSYCNIRIPAFRILPTHRKKYRPRIKPERYFLNRIHQHRGCAYQQHCGNAYHRYACLQSNHPDNHKQSPDRQLLVYQSTTAKKQTI